MLTEPIDLIAISREYGAGAGLLARALGERLGWRVLDGDIPRLVAERLAVPADALVGQDEHAPTFFERAGRAFILGEPELFLNPVAVVRPNPDDVAGATREVLQDAAARPPLIVVGHGAQSLFARRPGTLRVRLVAPLAVRTRLVRARRRCSDEEAVRLAHHVDADREHFERALVGTDVRDPLLYHLVINTALVGLSESVRVVADLVTQRGPARGTPQDEA